LLNYKVVQVYFYELSGEGSRERLETLHHELVSLSFVKSVKLLKNTKQMELYLLVVEASEELHLALPSDMRVWVFEEV
jgi:hypothetical protein